MNAVLISDLQIPFEHRDAFDFVAAIKRQIPDALMINMGDEVDQYTLSKYATSPNALSAGDEFEEAKHRLRDWFRAYPKMKVCISNHTYRVFKRATDAGIPAQFMRTIGEAYGAPQGWEWKDRWNLGGIIFEHGEHVSGKNAALVAAEQNRLPTAIGHQHSFGGVVYSRSISGIIWGLNTGCLIDEDQYAFDYGRGLRKKPTLGLGIVLNSIPYFVPMILDRRKRWTRRTYLLGGESEA